MTISPWPCATVTQNYTRARNATQIMAQAWVFPYKETRPPSKITLVCDMRYKSLMQAPSADLCAIRTRENLVTQVQ